MKNNKPIIKDNKASGNKDASSDRTLDNIGTRSNISDNVASKNNIETDLIYKTMAQREALAYFDGNVSKKQAKLWLEKFCVFELEWSKDSLLAQTKVLMTKSARSWFMGLFGEEINLFADFKTYFRRQYCLGEKSYDTYLEMCGLLSRGPLGISLEDYIFLIKGKNKELK